MNKREELIEKLENLAVEIDDKLKEYEAVKFEITTLELNEKLGSEGLGSEKV